MQVFQEMKGGDSIEQIEPPPTRAKAKVATNRNLLAVPSVSGNCDPRKYYSGDQAGPYLEGHPHGDVTTCWPRHYAKGSD